VRILCARKWPAGFLALAASFCLLAQPRACGQFPIRQTLPRFQPAAQPSPPAAPVLQPQPAQPAQPPHPAVARIVVPEQGAVSFGSGSLVDVRGQFGLVVTNWHVVRDAAGQIAVEFPGGFRSPAQVVKTDIDWDLAALSIYRPPVAPLPITAELPQVGQWLTIAGYGSGDYRAASGSLADYVSPSEDLPREMLDIAHVEARQGDSGGPILNQRGELCGVLFGAARGYTNGSYGGRVLKFLATVVPGGTPGSDGPPTASNLASNTPPAAGQQPQATALHLAQPPAIPPPPPLSRDGWATRDGGIASSSDSDALTPANSPAHSPLLAPPPRSELNERYGSSSLAAQASPQPGVAPALAEQPGEVPAMIHNSLPPRVAVPVASGSVDLNQAPPSALAAAIWRQVGGDTPVDQGKTVLAIVGVLSLLVFGWRVSRQAEPEHDE
jgi:hypothetical protein